MFKSIIKRDGREVEYNISKIEGAIDKAMHASNRFGYLNNAGLAKDVEGKLIASFGEKNPTVEDIQDMVETVLMENGFPLVSKNYILYRAERNKMREKNSSLMKLYNEITFAAAKESDLKRDNANVDGDTAMGTMLKYGSEGAKDFYEKFVLTPEQSRAHNDGDIHIHDFDFYMLTLTCCQIDILKLFKNGFSTGHGFLREPNDIVSYAALACIAIQSNQNDQHGGQSLPNFDFGLAPGVRKTFKKLFNLNAEKAIKLLCPECTVRYDQIKEISLAIEANDKNLFAALKRNKDFEAQFCEKISGLVGAEYINKIVDFAYFTACEETDKKTFQAMEAFIHNLNTMHSRAGAQTPFSSINYGTDTSEEGRMVIKNMLLATDAGLGLGETPIFPIQIFKVKEGVSYNVGDPNYDLFKLSMKVSAKRLFPNYSFLDAPFNKQYYKEGRPETEVAYMGCRTRVIGNSHDRENEIVYGRGNLSFTSINLPRIAIKSHGNVEYFLTDLTTKLDLCCKQLLDRFNIQSSKKVRNFPFLMGQGVWIGSEKLGWDDSIADVIKHGTLSVGFIGLAETLVALTGKHHGEDEKARNLGLDIINYMRHYLDKKSEETGLNFTLLATPAEGLSGRFVRIDKKKFGTIAGVTDREYYTNGFHVPVYYPISAYEKLKIEAPYHELTNAGHISYVELDGDTSNNVEAFEKIIRAMKELGIGYGSVNHPVDTDMKCGYTGIIGDNCPKCGRAESEDSRFDRIRRITGYLVGTLDRFNNAKRAEENDRVKHNV